MENMIIKVSPQLTCGAITNLKQWLTSCWESQLPCKFAESNGFSIQKKKKKVPTSRTFTYNCKIFRDSQRSRVEGCLHFKEQISMFQVVDSFPRVVPA